MFENLATEAASTPTTQDHSGVLPPSLRMSKASQLRGFVTDFVGLLEAGRREVGPAFTLEMLGSEPQVIFTDEASLADIVSGSRDDFGQANDMLVSVAGIHSMFLLDGEPHRESRRRTLSAFAGERMRSLGVSMKASVDRWLGQVQPGQRLSGSDAAADLMMHIILEAMFGTKSSREDDRLHDIVRRFASPAHSPLAVAFALMIPGRGLRSFLLGKRDPHTLARLPGNFPMLDLFPWRRRMNEFVRCLNEQLDKRRGTVGDSRDDILTHLLRSATSEGSGYTTAMALDEVMTLIFAGYQSSAITLAWVLYRLACAPEATQRLRQEIDEAFPGRAIDPTQLESLPYLSAVLNETFRLDGVGIGVFRRVLHERTIAGYRLPAGTQVFAYTYPQHRDPGKWQFPDEFKPEQFLNKRLKPHEFAPFGGGYRRCVGASFAMYSLRIALAQIARRLDWSLPPNVTVRRGMRGVLVSHVGPVPLTITCVRPDPVS